MRDILPHLKLWRERGDRLALATVIKTWGSAPRAAGAKMAVNEKGDFVGSVSGGCVETAVISEAMKMIATGAPAKLLRFGVSDEQAWSVGLACGGSIEVLVECWPARQTENAALPQEALLDVWLEDLAQAKPVVVARMLDEQAPGLGRQVLLRRDGSERGELGDESLANILRARAGAFFEREQAEVITAGATAVFVESIFPAPKLIIIGAVHIAIPLATIAKTLDYEVILLDPREAFATEERFPHVDRMLRQWPDEALMKIGIDAGTCIVILTHDPKLDDPALKFALQHRPAYLGVLGSKRTHEKRIKRLKEDGITEEQLATVHAPVGMDLGGRTPAEIALSIMAEIVALRRRA